MQGMATAICWPTAASLSLHSGFSRFANGQLGFNLKRPESALHSSYIKRNDILIFAESKEQLAKGVALNREAKDTSSIGWIPRRHSLALIIGLTSSLHALVVGDTPSALAAPPQKSRVQSPFDEKRLLEQNKRMQKLNNVPSDFPSFIREGFDVKVVISDKYVKCPSGLIYLDIAEGNGDYPMDGQQVVFHYIGYNESGRRVDSTYLQGRPARTRVGVKGMIPGFEEGIKLMKPGGKRRMIIPPELGPPVGPSTFFSAKQFEVFDVELLEISDCKRRTLGFYSDIVCD